MTNESTRQEAQARYSNEEILETALRLTESAMRIRRQLAAIEAEVEEPWFTDVFGPKADRIAAKQAELAQVRAQLEGYRSDLMARGLSQADCKILAQKMIANGLKVSL